MIMREKRKKRHHDMIDKKKGLMLYLLFVWIVTMERLERKMNYSSILFSCVI